MSKKKTLAEFATHTVDVPREDPESQPRKGPKQKELPGVLTPKNSAVRQAALAYLEAREAFQAASAVVKGHKTRLLEVLHKQHIPAYFDGEISIEQTLKEGVKVRRKGDEEEPE